MIFLIQSYRSVSNDEKLFKESVFRKFRIASTHSCCNELTPTTAYNCTYIK